MPRIKRDDARRILQGVDDQRAFWLHNGAVLHNVKDLLKALEQMDKGTFSHHVNKDKNDFSRWIKEVFNDRVLARDMQRSRTVETSIHKLRARINTLQGIARRKL